MRTQRWCAKSNSFWSWARITASPPIGRYSTASSRITNANGGFFFRRTRWRSIRAASMPSRSSGMPVASTARAYSSVWSSPYTNCAWYVEM